jgi:hypothetical protein
MAKKKVAATEVAEQIVEQTVDKTVASKTSKGVQKQVEPSWEIKDRVYYLKSNNKPLSRSVKSSGVYWFDESKGYERELKYCENQRTPFVDEMSGDQRLSHIVFRNGALFVPREKTVLQKMLSLYHPNLGKIYYEHKPQVVAENEIDYLEMEIEALMIARDLDIDMAEAVMRVEIGSRVSEMSSKELKRDLLLYAKRNPELFLELVNDDNVVLRNFGIKAAELNIIKLSSDQRHFMWGSNDRKLMTVPFDEHPYSALAQWFKTDEGMEVYTNIEKRFQ